MATNTRLISNLSTLAWYAFVLALLTVGVPRRPAPADGETVQNPVTVRFGLSGMGVAPAGTVKENTGHHHLLIDVNELPPMDFPLPNDDKHRHFGGGQTEITLELPAGKHTLQLVLGDANHIPHDPPIMSEKITIEVQ